MKPRKPFSEREFFLLLLPLYFAVHGYRLNREAMTAGEIFLLFAEFALAGLLLTAVAYLFFGSVRKAALGAFVLLFVYLFFGAMHDGLRKVAGNGFLGQYSFVLPVLAIALAAVFVYLKRTRHGLGRLAAYLNVLFLLLLLLEVPGLAKGPKKGFASLPGTSVCDTCVKPDIYFIIADEYADSTSLQQIFGFNNGPFLGALRSRGFHLVENSRSNYNYTPFAVASILQMNYLTGIEGHNQNLADKNRCYDAINRSGLWPFLQASGYSIRNHSIFHIANIRTPAPQNYIVIGKDQVLQQTLWGRLDRDLRYHLVTTLKLQSEVERLLYFEQRCNEQLLHGLLSEATTPASVPRFVYTHLALPHYPYYFRADGTPNPPSMLTEGNQVRKNEYIGYLQYGNRIYLDAIDQILKHAKTPPVIVLMGDHGFREFTDGFEKNARFYYMNLNAVLLPNQNYQPFYPGITGVNQMRALLNAVFAQKLPMLKDSSVLIYE